ncbi:hypothetical protein AEYBE204_18595 [Asticcacaulis sp. YBE204]|nr:hypothetical protein AEYBE204_18595 [Asticcacaulis sp. YBE204]
MFCQDTARAATDGTVNRPIKSRIYGLDNYMPPDILPITGKISGGMFKFINTGI